MKESRFNKTSVVLMLAIVIADIVFWYQIVFASSSFTSTHLPSANFLDVGQGDSELMIFQNGVKVLTDAGPDATVLTSLESVLGANDRSIDVAIISHPQSDHYGGFNYILDHYRVGAFIYNGRDDAPGTKSWSALLLKIAAKNIPLITFGKGDKIIIGAKNYGSVTNTSTRVSANVNDNNNGEIDILSPDKNFAESGELNDTGLVELVKTPQFKVLLPGDTGFDVQDTLVAEGVDLIADILKVAHHGSKYATDVTFLKAVDPKIAVIEVGAKNTFGHPAPETLARIASSTSAAVFRTDQNGTIQIWRDGDALKVAKGK
jgi:competence protein ComEC